ncbi:MAG: phenylalanine--tRNA ligase subunit alpha [Bdellovibrionales bacterium]|nr:phenylalanine--tRNA ligase subunit alpha [Bdellovibrionales bacterium]
MLSEKLQAIHKEAVAAFNAAKDSKDLYELKVKYLGKQGPLAGLMREMAGLSKEEKPLFGKLVNEVKQGLEDHYSQREAALAQAELNQKIATEALDLSLPGPVRARGARHPIQKVINEVVEILSRIGYSVRTGPMIEKDWYNFEALNIPADHPARDMQDTFYIDESHVLRTHTSPIQIRTMESEKPPLRILAPGSVFRCDSDVSHSPNFHQIEGLLIDRKVSMADLKGTIAYFVKEYFGPEIKIRFRPSFFPFTEPSAEVDCSCPICKGKGCRMCKHSGWIEIGGSGLVNPKVLAHCKLNPDEWQGFAFGFGMERMAIIKYGIEDIRLFAENDLRFLRQFEA